MFGVYAAFWNRNREGAGDAVRQTLTLRRLRSAAVLHRRQDLHDEVRGPSSRRRVLSLSNGARFAMVIPIASTVIASYAAIASGVRDDLGLLVSAVVVIASMQRETTCHSNLWRRRAGFLRR